MVAHPLDACDIDVCEACGALWIDWLDGELASVAAEALEAVGAPTVTADVPAPGALPGACPRCRSGLTHERFAVEGAVGTVALWRCGQCFGVQAARAEAERLVALAAEDRALPPAERFACLPPGLRRLVEALELLLGLRS